MLLSILISISIIIIRSVISSSIIIIIITSIIDHAVTSIIDNVDIICITHIISISIQGHGQKGDGSFHSFEMCAF